MTKLERIDAKVAEARKQHSKACEQRDKAITLLTSAAAKIKKATQALGRLEKQKAEARKEERARRTTRVEGDAVPSLQ